MAKQAVSRSISATPRKRRTAERKELGAPMHPAGAVTPTHDQIAQRAFELYLSRGATDGADLNDWLRAEQELTAAHH